MTLRSATCVAIFTIISLIGFETGAARGLLFEGQDGPSLGKDGLHSTEGIKVPTWKPKLGTFDAWEPLRVPGHFNNLTQLRKFQFPGGQLDKRIYRWEHLQEAMLIMRHQQFRHMLERLHRGDPITVLTYGSSITQDFSGCFHTGSVETLAKRLGSEKLPDWASHYRFPPTGRCCSNFGENPGWGNMFMQVINATWPHPGHTWINAGMGAAQISAFAKAACLESHLPAHLHLLILESYESVPGELLEQLIWRVFSYYQRMGRHVPAVILLKTGFVVSRLTDQACEKCLQDPGLCETKCRQFNHTLHPPLFKNPAEYEVDAVAAYYGFSTVSHRHFLFSLLRNKVAQHDRAANGGNVAHPVLANLTDCRIIAAFHSDVIHPRPIGSLLLSDYLLYTIAQAEQYLADPTHALSTLPTSMPEESLWPNGRHLPHLRCSTIEDARTVNRTTKPGDATVLVIEGAKWHFSEFQVHGARRKYKPGWVATEPGAVMKIMLNTIFKDENHTTTTVVISYLESYEHMGKARISCVSGCKCEPVVVDAQNKAQAVSSGQNVDILTQPPVSECVMQIEVLSETSSGEHKFKVLSVLAKTGDRQWWLNP